MNVELGTHDAFVASIQGNILQVNATALEHRAAKMAKGVCGQIGHTNNGPHPFNHVVECPDSDGAAGVAIRLREKKRPCAGYLGDLF